MEPAESRMERTLEDINIKVNVPRINVYSNYSGKPYPRNETGITKHLARQISNPVKWEQIVQLLFRKGQVSRNIRKIVAQ
jgi:acyl transferase domain-containing protein